ncbi:MAG: hypothetical protein WCJ26_13770 [bacterium]
MKISGIKKSFAVIASVLVTTVTLGLFVTYMAIPDKTGRPGMTEGQASRYDTIPAKKAVPQEMIDAAQKSVASGDAYFKVRDYLNAKSAYQMAVSQNPNDEAAREKLRKTLDLLRSQKAQNILFDVAVAGADKLFQAGEYEKAMQEYENASKLLPGDPYPKNKINEIIKIQVDNKVKSEEYARAIASADKFYLVKSYQNALLDYKKASGIKQDEKYPQDRIRELTALIAAQKAKDDAYNRAIILADQSFKNLLYKDAVKSYQDALVIKPEQTYPADKIKEIEGILARMTRTQADYEKYVALADSFYIDKKYYKARENYLMASSAKPNEAYPKEMLSKADKMLTGQEASMAKAVEEQYAATIAGADKLLADKSYEPARAEYVKASNLKSGEPYPKDRIEEIDRVFANLLKDKDEQYKSAIFQGDKAFANRIFETAKSEYQKALAVKPNEAYPKTRIAEAEKLIVAEVLRKAADSKYANSIGKADSLLMERSYSPAKAEFENALRMKPSEVYPKNKINEINAIMADLQKQKVREEQYAAMIAKADLLMAQRQYSAAKTEYGNAVAMKPQDAYPKSKMAEIDVALSDLAAKKDVDDRYAAFIASADRLLSTKSYEPARAEYQNALGVKPAETYPAQKITEIDKLLADLAATKSLEENYLSVIGSADRHLSGKNYDLAKSEYNQALNLKPAEKYPVGRIAEIDALLAGIARQKALDDQYAAAIAGADKLLAGKSYVPAKEQYLAALNLKASEQYPKDKIAEIDKVLAGIAAVKDLDDKYAASIARADNLLGQKSYEPARAEYQNALALKAKEQYPKDKMAEIDLILAGIAAAKALDDKYAGIIAGADKSLAAKLYDQARIEYLDAGKVKPSENYPKEKVAEIDKILADLAALKSLEENYVSAISKADQYLAAKSYDPAKAEYLKASALKPAEQYPKTKIAEIDAALALIAKQKALDDEYSAVIANADKLLAAKSYVPAKEQFQAALKIKAAEQYPKDKISEIDKVLADLAAIKDRDDRYAASVAKADALLAQKSLSSARTEYQVALTIKAQEQYPKDKIAEIDAALTAIAAAKVLDDKYAGIIAGADRLLASKTYDQARIEYLNAGKVKPAENYPKDKIAEIDKILADLAALKTLDENYKATILKADQLLAIKSYEPAKTEYLKASGLKPEEQYPKAKIVEIDAALALIAKQKALDDEYAATIANGDKLLLEKSYEPAKTAYQQAVALKGAEQYPKTKIAEIEKLLNDAARLKAIDDQYQAAIAGADKLLLAKSYDLAKAAFTDAGRIKPAEQYPKDKIMEIDGILAGIAKQKALDEQYKVILAKADQLLAANAYDKAKGEYANALNLKPAEQYPKDKTAAIDAILADLKAKEDAYRAMLANGDLLLVQKKYEDARARYQDALVMKPEAAYPLGKIAEINKALEELLGKQKYYENLVSAADNSLKDKDYAKAKETYQQALGIFPSQPYPKDQIALITNRVDSLYRANKALYDKAVATGDLYYNSFEFDKSIDAYTDATTLLPMEKYPREMITKIRKTIAENAIADVLKTTLTITSNTEKQFSFTPVNIATRDNNFVYIKIRNLSGKPFNVLLRYGKDKQANGGVVMRNLKPDGQVHERLVSVKDQDNWSREDNNWISLYPQGGDVEVSFIQVSRAK